ncbi:hypothetical protein VNO78_16370 [Psophocarpus tetragonolobus]|uniref:Uncharacterized protein n=1 Tax=Psophocarpus tetragonolobus TaxID=3891 RepID=A0AAN9SI78_PSOTE
MLFTRVVEKLSLATTPHPSPYSLHGLNYEDGVVVREQVKISFSIGKYRDKVLCDGVPMEAFFHMFSARPWQHDKKTLHNGLTNKITLYHKRKKDYLASSYPYREKFSCQPLLKEQVEFEDVPISFEHLDPHPQLQLNECSIPLRLVSPTISKPLRLVSSAIGGGWGAAEIHYPIPKRPPYRLLTPPKITCLHINCLVELLLSKCCFIELLLSRYWRIELSRYCLIDLGFENCYHKLLDVHVQS